MVPLTPNPSESIRILPNPARFYPESCASPLWRTAASAALTRSLLLTSGTCDGVTLSAGSRAGDTSQNLRKRFTGPSQLVGHPSSAPSQLVDIFTFGASSNRLKAALAPLAVQQECKLFRGNLSLPDSGGLRIVCAVSLSPLRSWQGFRSRIGNNCGELEPSGRGE